MRALALALQTAHMQGDAVRLSSDVDQWLRDRVALRPMRPESEAAAVVQPRADGLTRKELEILELLTRGYSNIAMAQHLFISESTVRTHLRSINHKLSASSRTQAIAIALKLGLVA